MSDSLSDHGTTHKQQIKDDDRLEKVDMAIKLQTGRLPTRPPYEQYLRVSKVTK
jgi:hypothetical protein